MEKADLIAKVGKYLPPDKTSFIEEAYDFAAKCHDGQFRLSGERFIGHPLSTADLLADLKLDATCIVGALLHDVVEDCGISLEELKRRFGPEVRRLVDGVSKLTRLELQAMGRDNGTDDGAYDSTTQAENIRKMLVAMAEDIRVVLIKLADRLHNMQTLNFLPRERQLRNARETLDIYAPLAHRLGMAEIKWQLEDLAFRYLQPEEYREISRLLTQKRGERERYIAQVTRTLQEALHKVEIEAEVTGRAKHIYSIHKKMGKYIAQGKEFNQIYDLFALRVLVEGIQDCYAALGVIHNVWHPIPGQFDDYIANPRENSYQSLHTTVMGIRGVPLEIQIRTYEMHQLAEFGIASHWQYKEGVKGDMRFEERMVWVRQLLEWQREVVGAEEFLESVKTDILPDQVFVYTPKGHVKELPAGSTPIDFAYRIHTDIGHRCIGAKVNGKLMSLDYQLRNGDTVEILTSKKIPGPRLDWLNQDLDYVKTAGARQAIRLWFRRQERAENIQRGRELIEKELKRLALDIDIEELAGKFSYAAGDEFLAALGSGNISLHQVASKLSPPERPKYDEALATAPEAMPPAAVKVLGVGDVLTHLARCCNPLPGNEIMGFITRSRGVTIHRRDCHNIVNEKERERLIQVEWGSTPQLYPVGIHLEARDRVGLLRDITTIVSEEKVNISWVVTETHGDGTVSEYLNLMTSGIGQLSRILSKLERVQGVISVSRSEHRARIKQEAK
ncbi:MAG: bifunctional (p)ppGpp synthetase/guanosine-3',5'-bis(diphosphate) 3'-pyrophosphohydrolase [Dehalococcoidia bacterium]